jgi:hypothetical protein
MTIKFRWRKRESNNLCLQDPGPPAMMEPTQPSRPPHPCIEGHDYGPLAQTKKLVLVFCRRCADVQRIPIHVPPSQASQSPRFAHLA